MCCFFFTVTATTKISTDLQTLSLHAALPIYTADAPLALTRDYFDALIAGAAPPLPVAALSRESASHRFPDKVDTANRREHKHVEPDHSAPKAGNRRPIAARGNVLVQRFSAWLARTGVSPNLISMMSIVFAALGAAALLELGSPWGAWLCAIAIVLRLLCNLFDGLVAVEHARKTPTGVLYNEVPDRVADSLFLVALG